jgi:hypothetical protein
MVLRLGLGAKIVQVTLAISNEKPWSLYFIRLLASSSQDSQFQRHSPR